MSASYHAASQPATGAAFVFSSSIALRTSGASEWNLNEVILRHGGEAQEARARFAALSAGDRRRQLDFLGALVLFPPDDTASNLSPGDRGALGFPQFGHGSIKLTVLFNDPTDIE